MDDQAATPDRTPLGDLTYLAQVGATKLSLRECRSLTTLVTKELGVSESDLSIGFRVDLLDHVLSETIAEQRRQCLDLLEEDSRRAARKECFQVAAAGELIAKTDEDQFAQVKKDRCFKHSKSWEALISNPEHQGEIAERELRAALWLGYKNGRSVARDRNGPKLLAALESAVREYLRDSSVRTELMTRVSGDLADLASSQRYFSEKNSQQSEVKESTSVQRDEVDGIMERRRKQPGDLFPDDIINTGDYGFEMLRAEDREGWVVIEFRGEVDCYTSPDMRKYLIDVASYLLNHVRNPGIILDIRSARYMDSTSFGVIGGSFKRCVSMGGFQKVVIDGDSPMFSQYARSTLMLIGYHKSIQLAASEPPAEALRKWREHIRKFRKQTGV